MRRKLMGVLSAAALIASHATAFASSGGGSGGVNFVEMSKLSVPIVDADRIDGVLNVTIVLDAADAEAASRIDAEMPRLRSALTGAALDFARLSASGFRPVDAEQLAHDLTVAAHAAEPGVARVLIIEVSAENR
ncbi:MAG: hypothetical protein ACOY45_03175 [Pseudomonadota bacterium]